VQTSTHFPVSLTATDRLSSGQSRPEKYSIPYYVRALALGIPAILLGLQLSGWLFFIPVITHGHFDFRHLYTAGYMVRTGHAHELYDYEAEKAFEDSLISPEAIALPFNHLAYEALLFVPLSLVNFRAAYFLMLALNLALLAVSYRLLRPYIQNLRLAWRWLPVAMFLTFLPNAVVLMQGQDSLILLIIFTAAFVALGSKRELAAGIFLGLALFKFQIVLPVAFLFLLWRCWRLIMGFTLSAAVTGAVSLALVGMSQARVYARSLFAMGVGLASKADQFRYGITPDAMPNLRGLIFGLFAGCLTGVYVQAITILLSVAALLIAAKAGARETGTSKLQLAITASALVSYHFLIHDMSILLIPIGTVLSSFITEEGSGGGGRWLVRASALLFVAPICMSFAPRQFYLVCLALLLFLGAMCVRWQGKREISSALPA
jgi:hypothetical protein